MNQDFQDLLRELCEAEADFLVVGAYALAVHGKPRATGDIDIWVEKLSKKSPVAISGRFRPQFPSKSST